MQIENMCEILKKGTGTQSRSTKSRKYKLTSVRKAVYKCNNYNELMNVQQCRDYGLFDLMKYSLLYTATSMKCILFNFPGRHLST